MSSSEGSAIFRALADFSRLRREAQSAKRGLKDLKDETGKANDKFDETDKSSGRASRGLAGLSSALGKMHGQLRKVEQSKAGQKLQELDGAGKAFLSTLIGIGAKVGVLSLVGVAAASSVGGVLSLLGAVASLSGVVGVLPAAGVAAVATMGALKLAFSGFSDALKEIGAGDVKKFEEAIKDLAPAAQETARVLFDIGKPGGPIDTMRKMTQQAMFFGLAPLVKEMAGKYIPVFSNFAQRVATTMNSAAKDVGKFLLQKQSVVDMEHGFSNLGRTVENLRPVGKDLTSVFVDLFRVGSDFLPGMTSGVARLTERFAAFVKKARETGQLKEWIAGGITQLKALGRTVVNVGRILGSVFKAAEANGSGFFLTLEKLTDRLADFLASTEGQETLAKIFKAASDAGDVLWPILKQLALTAGDVVGVLVKIGEKIGPGVEAVIKGIGEAVKTAEPHLVKLADAVGDLGKALGEAGPLVGKIAGGIADVLTPAVKALAELIKLIADGFNSLPEPAQDVIGHVVGLGVAVGAFLIVGGKLIKFFEGVVGNAKTAVDWIGRFGKESGKVKAPPVVPPLVTTADAAANGAAGSAAAGAAAGGFASKWKSVLGKVAKGAGVIGLIVMVDEATNGGIADFLNTLAGYDKGVQDSIDKSDTFSGKINRLFGAPPAVPGDYGDMRNWPELFGKLFEAHNQFWLGMGSGLATGMESLKLTAATKWSEFTTNLSLAWQGISDGWVQFHVDMMTKAGEGWQWITDKVGEGNGWVQQKITEFSLWSTQTATDTWSAIGQTISDFALGSSQTIQGWTSGAIDGMNSVANTVSGWFSSAWTTAGDAVSGFVGRAVQAIENLWDTVSRRVGQITDKLGSIGSSIGSALGGAASSVGSFLGGIFRNAGGWVPGRGPNKDSVPMWATPGEFVVKQDRAQKFGPLLEAINGDLGSSLLSNAAGAGAVMPQLASVGAVASTVSSPVGEGGVRDVHVSMVAYNPVAEKTSETTSRHMGQITRRGLHAARGRA